MHQTDSTRDRMTLTTRLPTAAAESTGNVWYLCTVVINVYVAGPDPDPNPREGVNP